MATTNLTKLELTVGVKDEASPSLARLEKGVQRFSGKLQRYGETMQNLFPRVNAGFDLLRNGMDALGNMGQILNPAVEMQRALNSVASLGAGGDALAALEARAKAFAKTYGGSATDIVNASYDIQGGIAGLEGKELAAFTGASATLAKAAKADVGVITDYMGTMYGIFKEDADVDKLAWVDTLASKTAWAAQMFKSDGKKMADAWVQLGAMGKAHGLGVDEQFAVLGELQNIMGGGESGTKFKAFLRGVGKAQGELGLSFVNAQGQMAPTVEILDKIRGKYGEVIDEAEMGQLSKAFGSDEATAFITALIDKTGSLRQSMTALGGIKGLGYTEDIAARATDAWDRWDGAVEVLKISFAEKMLPTLSAGLDKLIDFINWLEKMMENSPGLTRVVGLLSLGVGALGGALGALAGVSGVVQLAFTGLRGPSDLLTRVLGGMYRAIVTLNIRQIALTAKTRALAAAQWLGTAATRAWTAAQALGNKALDVAKFGLAKVKMLALAGATKVWTGAQWLLNAAMTANPVGLVIAAIVALIAVIGTLIYFWDDIRAYLGNTEWGQRLLSVLDFLGVGFGSVGEAALSVLKTAFFPIYLIVLLIQKAWGFLSEAFSDVSWKDIFIGAIKALLGPLGLLLEGVGYLAGLAGFDVPNLGGLLASSGGVASSASSGGAAGAASALATGAGAGGGGLGGLAALSRAQTSEVRPGGIFGQVSAQISSVAAGQGTTITIGEQKVYVDSVADLDQINEHMQLQGG